MCLNVFNYSEKENVVLYLKSKNESVIMVVAGWGLTYLTYMTLTYMTLTYLTLEVTELCLQTLVTLQGLLHCRLVTLQLKQHTIHYISAEDDHKHQM